VKTLLSKLYLESIDKNRGDVESEMKTVNQSEIEEVLNGFKHMTGIDVQLINPKNIASNKYSNLNVHDFKIESDKSCKVNIVKTSYGVNYGIIKCYDKQWIVGPVVTSKQNSEKSTNIKNSESLEYEKKLNMPEMSLTNFEYSLLVLFSYITNTDVNEIDYEYSMYRSSLSNSNILEVRDDKGLKRCMDYIKNNIEGSLSLKSIANYSGYNPAYLSRKFKKVYGINLNKYILEMKLKAATNYLENSDDTLSNISEKIGFSSQSHFQNTFKMVYQITPLEYRKSRKKKQLFNSNY
jgi:AraC-like DNA-binding protein